MYKVTLPTAIADRNFTRTATHITIGNGHFTYQNSGTCTEIECFNLNLASHLLEQGYELKIAACTPNPPAQHNVQDLLDSIHDYQCTIACLEGAIAGYKEQLSTIKLILAG